MVSGLIFIHSMHCIPFAQGHPTSLFARCIAQDRPVLLWLRLISLFISQGCHSPSFELKLFVQQGSFSIPLGSGKHLGGRGCYVRNLAFSYQVRSDLVKIPYRMQQTRFIRRMYIYYISMYNVSIRARCHFVFIIAFECTSVLMLLCVQSDLLLTPNKPLPTLILSLLVTLRS